MPTIHVNDINLYYEVHGTGAPLVLVPGLSLDLSELDTLIQPLSEQRQVIAFDNRGAGRSDKPDQLYSIEQMAGDTSGLLDALGIARADIMGISMGGKIALALALAHPELVNRLILVSTAARRVGRRPLWFGLTSLLATGPLFRGKYPQPRYAFLRQLQASSAFDCTARLGEIHAPTLVLHGKRDKTAVYARAEELHAGIAGSRLVPFDGGHVFFFFRERQPFLDTVTAFLAG